MEKYNFKSVNDKLSKLDNLLKEDKISLDDYFKEYKEIEKAPFEEAIDIPFKKAEIEINNNSKNLNIKNIDFDTYKESMNTFFKEKKSNLKDEIYNLQLEYLNGNIDFETFSCKYKRILNENVDIVG